MRIVLLDILHSKEACLQGLLYYGYKIGRLAYRSYSSTVQHFGQELARLCNLPVGKGAYLYWLSVIFLSLVGHALFPSISVKFGKERKQRRELS